MLAVTLFVVVITPPDTQACEPGVCGGVAMVSALQQAAQRVLGSDARVDAESIARDPPDADLILRRSDADGVIELSFTPDGQKAHLHCYVARETRWLDREITFGERRGSARSEISERGRLLGFAVATMYANDSEGDATPAPPPPMDAPPPAPINSSSPPTQDLLAPNHPERGSRRAIEFAGIVSSGFGGTASGLGASAGLRLGLAGPVWGRLFIAGRTGNIPSAQASTRTALLGGGLALGLLPESSLFQVGARADAFASYFDASHLSEDDIEPDRRSRWQAGGDLVAEGSLRLTQGAGIFLGLGVEAVLGKTEVYTHHNRVAVVPAFRATAELGFRSRF